MRIQIERMTGLRPREEPHLLEIGEAQTALDLALETGSLQGAKQNETLKALSNSNATSIWRYPDANPVNYWFEITSRANVARSPVPSDTWDRIYWTDSGGAKYAPASVALGSAPYPSNYYSLGMPSPTSTPVMSSYTAGAGANSEFRVYCETFVSAYDEESPPGPVTSVVDVDPTASVTVSSMTPLPSPPPGKLWNITKRRLYRTSFTGGTSAAFQLVVELPIATTSYVDSKSQAELGKTLDSEGYYPPPDNAYGLTVTESGMTILLKGNDVYLSENLLPHAYDPDNVKRLQYETVAAAAFEQAIVVMTKGDLYVGNGNTPAGTQLLRLADSQPCLSAAGVAVTRGGAYYPSPEGLVAVGTDFKPVLVTKEMFTRDQWQDLNPSSFVAGMTNGKYVAFYKKLDNSVGALIIDPTGKSAPVTMGSIGSEVKAAWRDPANDTLYIARGGNIESVGTSTTRKTWTWKSKEFRFSYPMALTSFIVQGSSGTVIFKTYLNGQLWSSKAVATGKVGRLPTGKKGTKWSFELVGSNGIEITEIRVAPSVEELFS